MYLILVYDIRMEENGEKRLRRVFKLCKKYLNHVQNSVFEGELSPAQYFELCRFIQAEIDKEKDSVIIFSSRDNRWLDKEIIGQELNNLSNII